MSDYTSIGIDLGTSYSSAAVYMNGALKSIPTKQGENIIPSYVAFSDEEIFVGNAAKNQASSNPNNTIFNIKRIIGLKYNDESVQSYIKNSPFKVNNKDGKPVIQVKYKGELKSFAPQEITSMILAELKKNAESYLDRKVTQAVITVPAYFNNSQRQATIEASKMAGFSNTRIINESTAKSIPYYLKNTNIDKKYLVFDLGGGGFEVSIFSFNSNKLIVYATSGDGFLSGEEFDNLVTEHLAKNFNKKHRIDISINFKAMSKLKQQAEKAKVDLSSQKSIDIHIGSFFRSEDISEILTQSEFEQINNSLFKKTLVHVQNVLNDSNLNKSEIDDIILTGSCSHIPKIYNMLEEFFSGKKISIDSNFSTSAAYGAAVQAAIIDNDEGLTDLLIIGATSKSIGIESQNGYMEVLVSRNTEIPAEKPIIFSTSTDNQETISIHVFEGERAFVRDNLLIGKYDITDIQPSARGVPQVEVTLKVDVNGILEISAEDKATSENLPVICINEE